MREHSTGLLCFLLTMGVTGPLAANAAAPEDPCRFVGVNNISAGACTVCANDLQTVLPPLVKAPIPWDQLVVSWNAAAPDDSWLEIEARGVYPDHATKFYQLALWSDHAPSHPRHSFGPQTDTDGSVRVDTLVLKRPGADVQLRLTLGGGQASAFPDVRFLGLSFLDSHAAAPVLASNRQVWGTILSTPERSQLSYPQERGWCSPTSLSMVLTRWAGILGRPELALDVPEVAAGVFDADWDGCGNWPFNTAFAGKFRAIRAYVTRLSGVEELEEWIGAGVPVILSAPWHLLAPGRRNTGAGHLIVCIGFTSEGDLVVNDPATNLKKGQPVRRVYKRQDVVRAWQSSHNTVYLVYPQSARIPENRFGHWETKTDN